MGSAPRKGVRADESSYDLLTAAGTGGNQLDCVSTRNAVIKEEKYQCSLEAFERKLENLEVPEHPEWEESIEWRNAVEQLERVTRKEK